MAGLSFRRFFKLLALILPAALLSVFLGPPSARVNTAQELVNAGDTGTQAQLWMVGEAQKD
jgi:hypothetical protein